MSKRTVIQYTTGPAGSGKTYLRCARYLVDEWLPEHEGVHWSNFPLGVVPADHIEPPEYEGETFAERIAAEVARRKGGKAEDYAARVKVIPREETDRWVRGESGPWAFFEGVSLAGSHISIDEIHNFCGRNTPKKARERWQAWLGEIRHMGATVEFLSQSPQKVAKEIAWEAGLQRLLEPLDEARDPFFKVRLADWEELKAGLITGEYETRVRVVEKTAFGPFWRTQASFSFGIDPLYFRFFDSFSAPQQGGSSGQVERFEFQKRTRLGLLWWFFRRYPWQLFSRVAAVVLVAWIVSGGGATVADWGLAWFDVNRASDAEETTEAEEVEELSPAERERDELRERLQAAEQRAEEYESRVREATGVAALTPRSLVLRDGSRYEVGERIEHGEYENERVRGIDYERRRVLVGDTFVRLGSHGVQRRERGRGGADEREGGVDGVVPEPRDSGPRPSGGD